MVVTRLRRLRAVTRVPVTVVVVVGVVTVMVVMVVVVVVVVVGKGFGVGFDRAEFVDRGGGGCGTVIFAQAPDGNAGQRPARTAHALPRGRPVMVVVLARRQAAALHQEQRATIRVQKRTDILQDLVAQRPHVQLVAYVFHLKQTNRV